MQRESALPRALNRLLRPPILTAFAVLQALLLAVVAALHLSSRVDPREAGAHPGTGDFAAFYTGALLVQQGAGKELYDFDAQRRVQTAIFDSSLPYQQRYLYPPGLAMLLAPVAGAGYVPAFLTFTALMVIALAFGLLTLAHALPGLCRSRRDRWTMGLLAASFLPVALTTFGGQNTALSLGLFAGLYAALHSRRPILAGILLGLLTFKPQYVVLPGLVLLGLGHRRTVAVGAAVGLLHYAVGALVVGPAWPLALLAALAQHAPLEFADNAHLHFSLPAVVRRVWGETAATATAAFSALAALLLLAAAARRVRLDHRREAAFFGLVIVATLLASPHLQFYEAGLLVLPAVLGLETLASQPRPQSIDLTTRLLLAAGFFAYPVWQLSQFLGVQPLALGLAVLGIWLTRVLFRRLPAAAHALAGDAPGTNRSAD